MESPVCLEQEMAPETASETAVKYKFQCLCGARVVATEKTVSCGDCGCTFEIRRVRTSVYRRRKRTHRGSHGASHIASHIGVAEDVRRLVEKPMIYFILYSLLLYDLYDLLCS